MAVALLLAAALPLAMVGGTPPAAEAVMRAAERPSLAERVLDEANVHACGHGDVCKYANKVGAGRLCQPSLEHCCRAQFPLLQGRVEPLFNARRR